MTAFCDQAATKLHIDINSCFATIEQQANPLWRGRPLVVAASVHDYGCILAASVEAKRKGVKGGMLVGQAKELISELIICEPDVNKYRDVHVKMAKLLSRYSDRCTPKSIDEFVMDLSGTQALEIGAWQTSLEIKDRIRKEIGEWITVSVGIAPSRWLAKVASNLKKPDGLNQIDQSNFEAVYKKLELRDLPGINWANSRRLNRVGIYSVWNFYLASIDTLRAAFQSVNSNDWYLRLHGFEVERGDFARKSFGNSFVLPEVMTSLEQLLPIVSKLVEKMGFRLRKGGYGASGVWIGVGARPIRWDGRGRSFWHMGHDLGKVVFDSRELYMEIVKLFRLSPYQLGVKSLAVSCFGLERREVLQLDLFQDMQRTDRLVTALDQINKVWGSFTVRPARMLDTTRAVPDRIAFGGMKELDELKELMS